MRRNNVLSIVRNHFDALANQYDAKSLNRERYLTTVNQLIVGTMRNADLESGRVLDVGCGTGTRAKNIFSCFPLIEIYGADISIKMLAIAKTRNLRGLVRSDMQLLPFQDESFDAITCLFNVIGYLGTPLQRKNAFLEFSRVLKPHGLLFIDFMNRWHLGEGINFRRSPIVACWMYAKSLFPDFANRGNIHFTLALDGQQIEGLVHGFSHGEIYSLLVKSRFEVVDECVVGYDSGELKRRYWQGQYFFVARKKTSHVKEEHHGCYIGFAQRLFRESYWRS